MPPPELPGVLSARDLAATAATIAEAQEADGAIPWFAGGHTDPWDHVECALALDVAGLHGAAAHAYDWLRRRQRADGSWAARYQQGIATQQHTDSNFCGYVALGTWHHFCTTRDSRFLQRMWPTVRAALDLVVDLQLPGGQIAWAQSDGHRADEALLTSSSSLYHSLRAGLAVADEMGVPVPDWELAVGRLGHAVARHPERFADKARFSMDWYYPVLCGALRGDAARRRLAARWDEFWVPDLGVRCVADRPWVTGAETCELAIALAACGERAAAAAVVAAVQHLRDRDGAYWTGYVYEDRVRWPVERSTWTAATVILAADAVCGTGPRIFGGAALPLGVDPRDVVCADEVSGSARLCDAPQ